MLALSEREEKNGLGSNVGKLTFKSTFDINANNKNVRVMHSLKRLASRTHCMSEKKNILDQSPMAKRGKKRELASNPRRFFSELNQQSVSVKVVIKPDF